MPCCIVCLKPGQIPSVVERGGFQNYLLNSDELILKSRSSLTYLWVRADSWVQDFYKCYSIKMQSKQLLVKKWEGQTGKRKRQSHFVMASKVSLKVNLYQIPQGSWRTCTSHFRVAHCRKEARESPFPFRKRNGGGEGITVFKWRGTKHLRIRIATSFQQCVFIFIYAQNWPKSHVFPSLISHIFNFLAY